MGTSRWVIAAGLAFGALAVMSVEAQPPAPQGFCGLYPEAPSCSTGEVSCATCHTAAPALNVYGEQVSSALFPDDERPLSEDRFTGGLTEALQAVESLDADGDGATNLDEILAGSSPSDATSTPTTGDCVDGDKRDAYDLCGYDLDFAYKRVTLDFCGYSPSYDDMQGFLAANNQSELLHDRLDACLDSEFWRGEDGKVWNMANSRIAPSFAIKAGVTSDDEGVIPLGDYDDDYAFWVYANTDDRDVRSLLTGRLFVEANVQGGVTEYTTRNELPLDEVQARGFDRAQLVAANRRAGMLTHRWALVTKTMFTAIPRTAAAAAYRHYLGYDIARLEGLQPVPNEPVDYDLKDVQREDCAVCHSTLDPLSYPFSRYEGIGGGSGDYIPFTYSNSRLDGFTYVNGEGVADTPEAGVIFGEPVEDLLEWAEVASNSEAFQRKLVLDYWTVLIGETPRARDEAEYGELVNGLPGNDYNVERMLHDLIDTEAYGAP